MRERIFNSKIKSDREIFIEILKILRRDEYAILCKKNKVLKAKMAIRKIDNPNEKEDFAERNVDLVYNNKILREELLFLWNTRIKKEEIDKFIMEIKKEKDIRKYVLENIKNEKEAKEVVIELWRREDEEINSLGDMICKIYFEEEGEEKVTDGKKKGILEMTMSEIITELELVEKRLDDKEKIIKKQEEKINKLEEQLQNSKNLKKDMSAINKRIDQILDISGKETEPINQKLKEIGRENEAIKSEIADVSKEIKKITVNKIIKEITDKQAEENKEVVKGVNKALEGIDKKIEKSVIKVLNENLKKIEESIEKIQVPIVEIEKQTEEIVEASTGVTLDEINALFT